tara:strand:+ start:231 stop:590 length:360 start_codon:yes stop_codon:yes gene_type:complete
MQSKTLNVSGKGEKWTVEVRVPESLEEFVEVYGETEALKYATTQLETNLKNRSRQARCGTISKTKLRKLAFAKLTADQLIGCAGDGDKLEQLVADTMKEVEDELTNRSQEEVEEEESLA